MNINCSKIVRPKAPTYNHWFSTDVCDTYRCTPNVHSGNSSKLGWKITVVLPPSVDLCRPYELPSIQLTSKESRKCTAVFRWILLPTIHCAFERAKRKRVGDKMSGVMAENSDLIWKDRWQFSINTCEKAVRWTGAIAEYPAHFGRRKFLAPAVPQWPNKNYSIMNSDSLSELQCRSAVVVE